MIFTAKDIRENLDDSVIINPYDEDQINPNSYDVRLGNYFYLLRWGHGEPGYYGPIYVPNDQPLVLPKGETVLAMTKEIVGGYFDVTTQIRAKSSTRRLGISICDDAGLGDVGYVDYWTLELTANTNYAVVKPNMRIAQVVFHSVKSALSVENDYGGQYRRAFPENMVPKKLEHLIAPVPDAYNPYILVDLIEDLESVEKKLFDERCIRASAPTRG